MLDVVGQTAWHQPVQAVMHSCQLGRGIFHAEMSGNFFGGRCPEALFGEHCPGRGYSLCGSNFILKSHQKMTKISVYMHH